ncbi:MAG: site-specific integrase [Lachnospiraceae bacterium]|nr:site-specific integrase [Lachnospiraceae bacterium]
MDGEKFKIYRENGACYVRIPVSRFPVGTSARYLEIRAKKTEDLPEKILSRIRLSLRDMNLYETDMTVEEWISESRILRAGSVERETGRQKNIIYELYIIPYIGQIKLQDINEEDVGEFLYTVGLVLAIKEVTARRRLIKKIFAVLYELFEAAVLCGYIPYNPANCYRPRHPHDTETVLRQEVTPEIEDILLKNRYRYPWGTIIALYYLSGMRRGEVLALSYDSYDRRRRELRVDRQLTLEAYRENRSEVYKWHTKTCDVRIVRLSDETVELMDWIVEKRKNLDSVIKTPDPYGFLFVDDNGYLLSPSKVNTELNYLLGATTTHLTPHDFRRAYATKLYRENGQDLEAVALQLGVTIQTAMIYIIRSREGLKRMANIIDREWEEKLLHDDGEMEFLNLSVESLYAELYGDHFRLSIASTGYMGFPVYVNIILRESSIEVRESKNGSRAYLFAANLKQVGDNKYAHDIEWHLNGLGMKIESKLRERYDLGAGVRLEGTGGVCEDGCRFVRFGFENAIQMANGEDEDKKKKPRRNRKTKESKEARNDKGIDLHQTGGEEITVQGDSGEKGVDEPS